MSLLDRSAAWLPWLRLLVLACGLAAAAVMVAGRWLGGPARTVLGPSRRSRWLAGLAGPLAYSLDTAATAHTGALPRPGRPWPRSAARWRGSAVAVRAAGFGAGRSRRPVPGSQVRSSAAAAAPGHRSGGTSGRRHGRWLPGSSPGGHRRAGRAGGGLGGNTQVSSAITKLLTGGASGLPVGGGHRRRGERGPVPAGQRRADHGHRRVQRHRRRRPAWPSSRRWSPRTRSTTSSARTATRSAVALPTPKPSRPG